MLRQLVFVAYQAPHGEDILPLELVAALVRLTPLSEYIGARLICPPLRLLFGDILIPSASKRFAQRRHQRLVLVGPCNSQVLAETVSAARFEVLRESAVEVAEGIYASYSHIVSIIMAISVFFLRLLSI